MWTRFERNWWHGICRTQRQADAWAIYIGCLTTCAVIIAAAVTAQAVHFFWTE